MLLLWFMFLDENTQQANFCWILDAFLKAYTSPEATVFQCLLRWGVDSTKTPSIGTWEPPGGFCDVGCFSSFIAVFVMLVVVLHSLLLFWCWLLFCNHCCFCDAGCCSYSLFFDVIPHASVSYCQVFTPVLYFQPSSSQSGSQHFHFNLSGPFFQFYCKCYGFEWAFFKAFFTLCSFPTFLPQPAFIKASLGAGNSFLKFAGLHADPRNPDLAHLFIWFAAIHNLDIQKNLYLNCIKYYHEFLVVKSLVYLLLTHFKLFSLVQSHM